MDSTIRTAFAAFKAPELADAESKSAPQRFHDTGEVLEWLRSRYDKIALSESGISAIDLWHQSVFAPDATTRDATRRAAENFPDLVQIHRQLHEGEKQDTRPMKPPTDLISREDLTNAINLYHGNILPVASHRALPYLGTGLDCLFVVPIAALGAAGVDATTLLGVTLRGGVRGLAAGALGLIGYGIYRLASDYLRLSRAATEDAPRLRQWTHPEAGVGRLPGGKLGVHALGALQRPQPLT